MKLRHFLILAAAALVSACGRSERSGNKLIVGMDMTYPPFEYKNEKGEPDGVDVRIAEALAEDLGRELELRALPFESLIPELKNGSIDLAISAMTANDERRESIDFSDPYVYTSLALMVGKDSPIASIDDLKAKKDAVVVAKLATTGATWVLENMPEAKLVMLDDEVACVQEVAQGKADAFIYDQLSIFRHQQKNAATTKALLAPFQDEAWAIGIRKGNEELKRQVNDFLKRFRESGGPQRLAEQYLVEERKLLDEMGMEFIFR